MEFVTVAKTSDLPQGSMKGFTVNGNQILISNVDGRYYAMDAVCSHMSGYLPAGRLQNNIITCPVHHAQFDVTSGKVHKNVNPLFKIPSRGKGATDLNTYVVEVEGDEIKLQI